MHVVAIADLDPGRARERLLGIGWPAEQLAAGTVAEALAAGTTRLTADAGVIFATPEIDVVIDITGHPLAAIGHALESLAAGKHLVNVTVEADVLVGPLLAQRFEAAGLVYSLAYGDQPALIAEQVDWARTAGLTVVCAGKGTKYLPAYHRSTPETVWQHYGLTPEQAAAGGMNPQMFNSFLDGTKSAIEMAAVANACGLTPQPSGLSFPPCGTHHLARVLRPREQGGVLEHGGTVEVVSCLERDGRPVHRDLRWGVYTVFEAADDYVARCFFEYGLETDPSGRYAAMYKPFHLIGLELGISVASAALLGQPTGQPREFRGDVAAVAKTALATGTVLDGEGGETVFGRLMRAEDSLRAGALPLGFAAGAKLRHAVAEDAVLRWDDVEMDHGQPAVALRREMEAIVGAAQAARAPYSTSLASSSA